MALVSCNECGHQVSDQAASCPSCGHPIRLPPALPPAQTHRTGVMTPPKKGTSGCAVIVLGSIIAIVVATCFASMVTTDKDGTDTQASVRSPAQLLQDAKNSGRSASARLYSAQQLAKDHPATEEGKEAALMVTALQEEVRQESIGKQWSYSSNEDAMTSKKGFQAVVRSTNVHEFEFPYNRPQRGSLILRDHPRYGSDVMFEIERGQLQCRSYSGCDVMVRFGDAPARRYGATGPEDSSTEILFFENQADFRRRMQDVDVVRISASIYQQGAPIWEFDVSGFKPDKMK